MDGSWGSLVVSTILKIFGTILIAVLIITGVSVYFFAHTTEIKSKVKIQPEIELTTDGKTIDTLYIYKVK